MIECLELIRSKKRSSQKSNPSSPPYLTGVYFPLSIYKKTSYRYNACIFAYGQTGSGKTYTMQGSKENPGVFTRTILQLFRVMEEREGTAEYSFEISLLEIYNESIRDLLSSEHNKKLEVKQGGNGNYVPNLTQIPVKGPDEVERFLEIGTKNRAVGKTNMNEHSSRSHLVFTITVMSKNKLDSTSYLGKLHLIDLAGNN